MSEDTRLVGPVPRAERRAAANPLESREIGTPDALASGLRNNADVEVVMPGFASSSVGSPSSSKPSPGALELRRGLVALRPELLGRAMRLTHSATAAEDLVQDTVERALKFEANYLEGTNVRAWVHQILFSVFITRCRRARRERKALGWLGTDPCAWTTPDAMAPTMIEVSPGVKRALDALPPAFRKVVELVDLEEMSYRDAADEIGVPVGTVMSRLHRGRKLLASELAPAADLAHAA